MKKLFLSFTATIRALRDGNVTESDLANGLFYFGCVREHALDPNAMELSWFKGGREAHATLYPALLAAEAEGRVAWRQKEERNSYKQLNELLKFHGFPEIAEEDGRSIGNTYCYPGVADRVRERNLQIQVIR